ncbi:MAG: sodium:solute symporter [Candidatus Eremiobacteraeota bacterium]|nr:sodium:solute symporter [Candidatus Eremiobacteraeota bacterium]
MGSGTLILIVLVLGVTAMGFFASRWGAGDLTTLDEWALGGRRFGTVVSWFLLGGDLYTAYTFIAVPALVYGVGALGFFAVPYATIAYPIAFAILSRFWTVAHERGYVTAADFVRDRFRNRTLEVLVAVTGVLAALPYIALQLDGMQAVFSQVAGVFAIGRGFLALAIPFVLLAAYTYTSGLRAPAMIAFVKDALIYVTVIAAIVVIPAKLGGWEHIFAVSREALAAKPKPGSILLAPSQYFAYATMAFGSSLSLFIYPHSITSVLAAKSRGVIRRNAALLPVYSLLLGFLALLGYCGLAAGIKTSNSSAVVPLLVARFFPDWFAGVAWAAIVIGALVPAAIMAIGSANLFASNVFNQYSLQRASGEARTAKLLTLVFCAAALVLVLFVPVKYAIYFQLLGGAWMLQIFPSFVFGLYTAWFDPRALIAGWALGMLTATAMAVATGFTPNITVHVAGLTITGFIALYALAINLAVTALGTLLLGGTRGNNQS